MSYNMNYNKIMRVFILLLVAIFSMFTIVGSIEAKVLPQAKTAGKAVSVKAGTTVAGIGVSPRLRGDRRALIINFSNLQNAKSVSYSLTYNTSTQQEGAIGSINLGGSSNASEELLFGTCSKGVCTYHVGIKNARLEVSFTLKSGKKYIKKYKIRV